MKNWISLFTLMIALAACSNAEADVFAEVRAGNGDLSVIFADDLFGPHANSAAASLTDINPGGSTSMSGESSVAQTTVNGLSTLQFQDKRKCLCIGIRTRWTTRPCRANDRISHNLAGCSGCSSWSVRKRNPAVQGRWKRHCSGYC